jgi:hypothetical protein
MAHWSVSLSSGFAGRPRRLDCRDYLSAFVLDAIDRLGTRTSSHAAPRSSRRVRRAFTLEIPADLRPPPCLLLVAALLAGTALLVPGLRRRPLVAAGLAFATKVSLGSSCDPATSFAWVHTDLLGTPLAATDSPTAPTPAKVIWRASYEPFGKATVSQGPDGDGTGFVLNVRFPGAAHFPDPEYPRTCPSRRSCSLVPAVVPRTRRA